MILGKVNQQSENAGVAFKKYVGYTRFRVVAVNPTLKELNELGINYKTEPEYVSKLDVNGTPTDSVRIDFWLKAVDDNTPILSPYSITLVKAKEINKDGSKCKVIDSYGRTAWVTKDEFTKKAIPVYNNGPVEIDSNYSITYRGQEALVKFLATFFGIPSPHDFKMNKSKEGEELEACKIGFSDIDKFFTGNISEIKENVDICRANQIVALAGIRHKDEKDIQVIFRDGIVSIYNNKPAQFFEARLNELSNNGSTRYSDCEFVIDEIREYVQNKIAAPAEATNDSAGW